MKWFIQNIIKPLYFSLRGWRDQLSYERFYQKRLACSVEENVKLQNEKLLAMLRYAIEHVPYYAQIADTNGIRPTLETVEEDLRMFPILTKDIIREHFEDLQSRCPQEGRFANTSGGSTGVPVKFIQDKRYRMQDGATVVLDGFSGYEFGDKMVKLWGSERDIIQGSDRWSNKLLNRFFYRQLRLNSFRMSEEDMRGFVDQINRFRPTHMVAYVQSAYELARFIERNGLHVHRMRGIITSAGTLYPDFREKIEAVFNCPVFNRYGSREAGNMAMECPLHEGMHLNILNQYMEIVDTDGQSAPAGETGRVVITTLTNYSMPLIRFEIGDMAIPSNRACSCGRGLPIIESIKGRTVNVFRTRGGTLVDGEYFTHLFYGLDFIRQFQVVQEDYDHIVVRYALVGTKNGLEAVFEDLREKISLVMGHCRIEFVEMDQIPPTASGKYVYTVSNI